MKGMGPIWPHDNWYSPGKSRPIRNSDPIEPARQDQGVLFRGSLIHRAMDDKRFDLSASSDDFAHFMHVGEASDWATEFEKKGTAPHVFATQSPKGDAANDAYGGLTQPEFQKLPAEERLKIANRVEAKRRACKN